MSSRQLSSDDRKYLEKYVAMSIDELMRSLNYSLLRNSGADNIDDMLRGRFFLLSDIKTILHPSIISSRTYLLLSEVRQVLKSNKAFLDSLEKLLAREPNEEELIVFLYDFLRKNMERSRDYLRIATYICRVGVKAFLEID